MKILDLPDNALFTFPDQPYYLYRRVAITLYPDKTVQYILIKETAFYTDDGWFFRSEPLEQNCNPYATVIPIKLTMEKA